VITRKNEVIFWYYEITMEITVFELFDNLALNIG